MAQVTLFYDADCGFCQASVDWLMRRAKPGTFEPVAYQNDKRMHEYPMVDLSVADKGIQALGPDGALRARAKATGYCLTFVSGWGWLGRLMLFSPIYPLAALGYAIVARNRRAISRWMGRGSCQVRTSPRE